MKCVSVRIFPCKIIRLGRHHTKFQFRRRKSVKMAELKKLLINLNDVNNLIQAEMLTNRSVRRFNQFINPLEYYSDEQFVKLYRLAKPVALDLIRILEPHLIAPSRRSALSMPRKVSTWVLP